MTSINLMVKRLAGLVDTKDLTDWENAFVKSVLAQSQRGDNTTSITEKQLNVIERIFYRHFAG